MKGLLSVSAVIGCLVAGAADGWTWDFTKGVPAGGTLRAESKVKARGLVSSRPYAMSKPGGFQLKGKFAYPEAFRFEAEFVVEPTTNAAWTGAVWDDMYVTVVNPAKPNGGLQVSVVRNGKRIQPLVWVAIDGKAYAVRGEWVAVRPGEPSVLTVTFDGNGGLRTELDGRAADARIGAVGAVTAPSYAPVLGDRVGSNYMKFEGALRRVALVPLTREPATAFAEGRMAFERGETSAALSVVIENPAADVTGLRATVRQLDAAGREVACTRTELGDIRKGAGAKLSVPVETRLRPGRTVFAAEFSGTGADGRERRFSRTFECRIGPTFALRMPTVMWGDVHDETAVADFGFTHGLTSMGFDGTHRTAPDDATVCRIFDRALVNGFRLVRNVRAVYPDGKPETDYYRHTREGRATGDWQKKPVPEVSHPDMIAWAKRGPEAETALLKDHPAFGGALAVSENRDHISPSYHTEAGRYRRETGREVPPEAVRKICARDYAEKKYPDGIVPEDDPVLAYYRWFWHGGDGWPAYLSAIADGYRRAYGSFEDGSELQSRRPFFTFHDPAVRCPPVWGSGGSVDCLNQWCYAVPEPMNVAGPIEEMFAMAAGRPGQQVMSMTQLICYRKQMAPMEVKVSPEPDWVKRRPEAGFPTIPPDTLQEATWSMLAKPVRGIMYHGWGTIYETGEAKRYTYTNPESADRLRHLLKDVVAPLGPSLLKIGRAQSPVAVLESGTTALLGGPASWGWTAPAVTFFQRARLDPRVVYEEAVVKGALKDGSVKVLYAPQFVYSTPAVVKAIKAFQAAGGILVGDEQMLKALKPDVRVPVVSFFAPPASDHTEDVNAMEEAKGTDLKTRSATVNAKKTMQAQAEDVRRLLAQKGYRPSADSSSSEIVVYGRRWKDTPYLFAVNDKRTFGDYVGQWGKTMEKGLSFAGDVTLVGAASSVGAVYELSRGGKLPFSKSGGDVTVPLSFETNDGRLLVFLPEEIAKLDVSAPLEVAPGGALDVTLTVRGASGRPVPAVLPVEVRLYDAAGAELDGAGFAAAEGGVCRLRLRTNLDDAPGEYRLVCRDRASGLVVTRPVFRGRLPWWKRLVRRFRFRCGLSGC